MILKELAQRLASLGVLRSALTIYESLQMWDDVINCYVVMDEERMARKVIDEQMLLKPNDPRLLCILGDLAANPAYW